MRKQVLYPQRLISFLQEELGSQYSGKFLRRVLEAKACRVNGSVERFASVRLREGDWVELVPKWEELSKPSPFEWLTLYEDEETRWVYKPAGWVCGEKECLASFGKGIQLIHRLDKETTGVLGLAKGELAFAKWAKLFAQREIHKSYLAIVDGVPKKEKGEIRNFLKRKGSFQGQTIWGSGEHGLEAITKWECVKVGKECALLHCEPVTGRTHQIRVHLAEMGHPILVDRQYAKRFRSKLPARRILLHAKTIETPFFSIEAPLPEDFQEALSWIES
ncbi:MAG TPA: RluA family pseudouridine synthase [Chlamydiales bacterium]|nr:RluA family pseudouridine synthase [Chlamydiales bacterium]